MAFRKRNIGINRIAADEKSKKDDCGTIKQRGVRPSPLTSHSVTSSGASSLDSLLGGHGGIPLGTSLLIEESGTTDFAGALLRFYAAEGICQRHVIHLVGVDEGWVRELPGVIEERVGDKKQKTSPDEEKMRIAWRYEKLAKAGENVLPHRSAVARTDIQLSETQELFSHNFDLTERLVVPPDAKINYIRTASMSPPFDAIVESLEQSLTILEPHSVHRLVMPTILSPASYHPQSSRPEKFLQFLHSVRSMLCRHRSRLTALITLPLELYARRSGLVRYAEILCDGVLELTPFPHLMDKGDGLSSNDQQPQGMVKVHKLPIDTERGEGGAGPGNSIGEDLAFTISRRRFVIGPFSLPPLESDQDSQIEAANLTAKDVDF